MPSIPNTSIRLMAAAPSTTRPSAAAAAGLDMIVGATTQRIPSASTAAARSASAVVDHERGRQLGVQPGHTDHRRLVAELDAAAGRRDPSARRRRRSATRPPRRSRRATTASRTPGTASTGPIDTIGFDGRDHDHARPRRWRRARRARAGPRSAPSKRTALTGTECCRPHEVLLERDLARRPRRVTQRAQRGRRSPAARRSSSPQAAAISAVTSAQRGTGVGAGRCGRGGCRGRGRRG